MGMSCGFVGIGFFGGYRITGLVRKVTHYYLGCSENSVAFFRWTVNPDDIKRNFCCSWGGGLETMRGGNGGGGGGGSGGGGR